MNAFSSVTDLSKAQVLNLIDEQSFTIKTNSNLEAFYKANQHYLSTKILTTFFTAPSLRTKASFISAFLKLGGSHMEFQSYERSVVEGNNLESLQELIGYISQYCDVIASRTRTLEEYELICQSSNVQVISAGHGASSHPTTTLNYLADIYRKFARLDNLSVLAITMDNKRCINSFKSALSMWNKNTIDVLEPIQLTSSNEQKKSPHKIDYFKENLKRISEYDILFFDESHTDYITDQEPEISLNYEMYEKIKKHCHIIHAKPVVKLFDSELAEHLRPTLENQSRNSSILKSIIFRNLINK